MMKIERYENGEITFICECKVQLVLYCGEKDNTGKVICENCGRRYIGSSCIDINEFSKRDIPTLEKKVTGLVSEMVDLTARKGEIEEGLIQLDYKLKKARDFLEKQRRIKEGE